jgi:hypothetical protein
MKNIGAAVFVVALFLVSVIPATVNAQINEDEPSFQTVVVWEEEPIVGGHYFGMIESLNEQLFAYSEVTVHTLMPEPENGHQGIPFVYMDVFIEENRLDHEAYLVRPYIVYYEIIEPLDWERHEINIPPSFWPFVAEDEIFPRTYVGSLKLGKGATEDVVYPFRTGIGVFHFVDGQWTEVDNVESNLGFWYIDVSPYRQIHSETLACSPQTKTGLPGIPLE